LRGTVLARLADEIAGALADRPDLRLLIGHGSGSFGHMAAHTHNTRAGVQSPEDWLGYAETARAAAQLNRLVVDALWQAGVPALGIQPSASAHCQDGELLALEERPIRVALEHGLAPVIYGDVALDRVRGGTIVSTEELFAWLAPRLRPRRVILVGEVAGVLSADPASGVAGELVPQITPETLPGLAQALGGSRGVDVTGGMVAKVRDMLALAQQSPGLSCVQIVSGLTPGLVRSVLGDPASHAGTRILHTDTRSWRGASG
jgi:isopentenyl phosphate kinase